RRPQAQDLRRQHGPQRRSSLRHPHLHCPDLPSPKNIIPFVPSRFTPSLLPHRKAPFAIPIRLSHRPTDSRCLVQFSSYDPPISIRTDFPGNAAPFHPVTTSKKHVRTSFAPVRTYETCALFHSHTFADREGLADRHVVGAGSLHPQVVAGAESRTAYGRKSKRIDVEHVTRIGTTLIGIGSGLKARREVRTSGKNRVE